MEPLPGGNTMYWAPEVFYENGLFYMYYSVGNETLMEIRVAVAEQPSGPFVDSGHKLTSQQFAIDAHVFKDEDGSLYLFYATDFLEYTHIGTGTVIDRLLDPFTPTGQPRPVTRARYDWQVYDPHRPEKGGVRWHTIEGPFVLKHRGRYYQMFSGGNWQNLSYGVSYAISDSLDRQEEWDQVADGEKILPVLRTIPGKVIGPGHNSVVRGPDNRQLFCVYHRWAEDGSERLLAIDPLDWAGERLLVAGPSFTPQPLPVLPITGLAGRFEDMGKPGLDWKPLSGEWQVQGKALHQENIYGPAEASFRLDYGYFLLEIDLKALSSQPGSYGLGINRGEACLLSFLIEPEGNQARLTWQDGSGFQEQMLTLPSGFNPRAYHLLRLEVQDRQISIALDFVPVQHSPLILADQADNLRLICREAVASFAGFTLTPGWEDLFLADQMAAGWQESEKGTGDHLAVFTKGELLENYELVLNIRPDGAGPGESNSFFPAWGNQESGPKLTLCQAAAGWVLQPDQGPELPIPPGGFDPLLFQQFRFRKQGQRMTISWEGHFLGELQVPVGPARIGIFHGTAVTTFDMVRVTAL